jgi:hypothetical protein
MQLTWTGPSNCVVSDYIITVSDITASTLGLIGLPQPINYITSNTGGYAVSDLTPGHTYKFSVVVSFAAKPWLICHQGMLPLLAVVQCSPASDES